MDHIGRRVPCWRTSPALFTFGGLSWRILRVAMKFMPPWNKTGDLARNYQRKPLEAFSHGWPASVILPLQIALG